MSILHQLLHDAPPDRPAVTFQGTTWTYADLAHRSRLAAGWLRTLEVHPGQVVALQLPKTPDFLALCLGAWGAGITVLPLNDRYTDDEIRYACTDAGACLAVLARPRPLPIPTATPDLDGATPADLSSPPSPDALGAILYTSGTTGRPKGARLRQRHILATVEALHEAWGWSPEDLLIHALPVYHVHGLFVAALGALRAGAHQVWLPRFQPADVAAALTTHRATVFMGVPTFYTRLLREPLPDLSHVRLFTSGSAPLPAHVHRAFQAATGHAIVERYGMTEIGIVLSNPLDGPRKPGSVGLPLRGVEVRICDRQTGADLPPGEVGEVLIRAPSMFEGYHRRPDATADALRDGWMHTGDQGRLDADGYVHLVGRRSDLILCGGLNVYPGEVEGVLAEAPGVAELAVFGVADPDLGEVPHAAVVGDVDPEALLAFARAHLAPYKVPRAIHPLDTLPRNSMGKVQKKALRHAFAPVLVRDARPEEASAIARRNVAMALETEELALDPDDARRGAEAVFTGQVGARYLIAEVDGEVAGQLMLTREWSDWRARWVWWIQSVYVEPASRGRGVYRSMYAEVLRQAAAHDVPVVRLYVDHRNTRAAAVYRRCGMNGDHYALFEQELLPSSGEGGEDGPAVLYAPDPGDG